MPMLPLVPTSGRLELRSLALEGEKIILIVRTCGDHAPCPRCGQPSARVHSHYYRTLADLPWAGIPTHISLWSRRFFCDTADCPRRVFTERLPGVAAPHGSFARLAGTHGVRARRETWRALASPARDPGLWEHPALVPAGADLAGWADAAHPHPQF